MYIQKGLRDPFFAQVSKSVRKDMLKWPLKMSSLHQVGQERNGPGNDKNVNDFF